jgi:DNA-binding IclR family transcriptional regulator
MSSIKKNTKTSDKARKVYTAPALEKGLDLLELLAVEPNGLNISQITSKLDKSVGELFRMLVVLEQRGYVEMIEGTDKYKLTLQLFKLTNNFRPIKNLNNIASLEMEKLSYDIEQSCHLVIYYEGKGHVIVQQDPPSERMFSVRVGAEVPLVSTCSGHVLLAFTEQDKYLKMIEKIPSHHIHPDQTALKAIIERVAKQGYESIPSAQAQGVRDISFPIFDHNNTLVAVLAVPFLEYLDGSHKINFNESLEMIKQTALRISNKLGFQGF